MIKSKKIKYLSNSFDYDSDQIFTVSNFEGPLDLLLFLIKSKKLDILELDLSEIADQYINILMHDPKLNLDQASEYFLIASKLLSLRTKVILNLQLEEEKVIDSDEENLIESLIKYEKVKTASVKVSEIFDEVSIIEKIDNDLESFLKQNKNFEEVIIKNTSSDLGSILESLIIKNTKKTKQEIPTIRRRKISIEEVMADILRLTLEEGIYFTKIIENQDKIYIAVVFLGVLELTSKSILIAEQKEGDIYIKKNE